MKSKASISLPWPILVGAKFIQVHPVGTICALLLALPGQIALIASFLLPIKIVMLMASDGMPSFMPGIAANMDKKMLISLLAGLSVAAFIFHHLTNKAIHLIARSGVSRIEKRNQKLHLFEGQEDLTRNSYTRYIDTVASVNFVLLGTALLFAIYPEVATTVLAYLTACIIGTLTVHKITSSDTESFTHAIQKKLPILSGIGFFLIFLWVLSDYIFFSIPESFIALLISVILGRQLLTRTSAITNSLIFFYHQKQKLRALLFHREVFQPEHKKSNSIWDFLDPATPSHRQLQDVLQSFPDSFENDVELAWHDSGLPGICFLTAKAKLSDKAFLIKIFEKKKATEARHEAALLLDAPETLPCPKMVVGTAICGLFVHILDITGYSFSLATSNKSEKDEVTLSVSKVAVPSELLSRYIRSHRMLWDQLEELQLQQLELISKDASVVNTFLSKLPKIQNELKRLPLRLYNPQLMNTNIHIQNSRGEIQLIHWGKWSLEPLGTGLPQPPISKSFSQAHTADNSQNTLPYKTPPPDPMTAQLSFQLYKEVKQHMLLKALETMNELSHRHD